MAASGNITLVSRAADGSQANTNSWLPVFSRGETKMDFSAYATYIGLGSVNNGPIHSFVNDLLALKVSMDSNPS